MTRAETSALLEPVAFKPFVLVTHADKFRVPHPDFIDIPPHDAEEPEPSFIVVYTKTGTPRFVVLPEYRSHRSRTNHQVLSEEPRQNAAKAFLAALRDDWKPKIQTVKPAPPKKPKPEEPQATDEERAQTSAKLREFIETLRASR